MNINYLFVLHASFYFYKQEFLPGHQERALRQSPTIQGGILEAEAVSRSFVTWPQFIHNKQSSCTRLTLLSSETDMWHN
jgi:hypothetical protein